MLSVGAHNDDVNSVTFADATSSNVFVSGSDDSMLKVWDRRSLVRGKPAGCLPGHTEGITYIAPKGDGRYCISNSKDQSVRLWDLRTGQAHRTLLGHTAPISCVQFDETHLVSGSLDKTVRVWDLRMGSVVDTLHYDYPVTALQFDSRKVLVACGAQALDVRAFFC